MSHHIVSIDSAACSLSCRDGQLTCKSAEGEHRLPMEDVASIVITSFSASIHSKLFLDAAKQGVALIICEAYKPVSVLLPANRSTDTALSRATLMLAPRQKAHFWRRTIDAKCQNQLLVAEHLSPGDEALGNLAASAYGRNPHKEAVCAKLFWQILGRLLHERDFRRDHARSGFNQLLNYGYAVLLSTVLQKLFAVGLDPTFGIGHATRERATPLAYDLMEQFRPCVDKRAVEWVRRLETGGDAHTPPGGGPEPAKDEPANLGTPEVPNYSVTKEYRRWITGFALERVEYLGCRLEVQATIEKVVRGFRRALVENQPSLYRPWIAKNTKWAG